MKLHYLFECTPQIREQNHRSGKPYKVNRVIICRIFKLPPFKCQKQKVMFQILQNCQKLVAK